MILGGKCAASIVVASSIEIAKTQDVVVIDIAGAYGEIRLLEERNGVQRSTMRKESCTLHLHGFAIGGSWATAFSNESPADCIWPLL